MKADGYRADLVTYLQSNGRQAFSWVIPQSMRKAGNNTVDVKFAGSSISLQKSPRQFTCASAAGGRLAATSEPKPKQAETSGNWSTYPNPVEDVVMVQIPSVFDASALNFMLHTTSGRQIAIPASNVQITEGQARVSLASLNLPFGLYFISVYNEEGALLKSLKIMKK